ncbi:hypothetical protein [Salmonella enterica]|uniref:hypothetical protein n=1 Tax=Salmonella enterica TaxID=28901 RepID=UPI001C444C27|nr:hypothetical protein [Salmonella enterica]HCM1965114.1 hypothetical protein [Salmonella enterica subsp. salamae serovar 56:l,v:z39]
MDSLKNMILLRCSRRLSITTWPFPTFSIRSDTAGNKLTEAVTRHAAVLQAFREQHAREIRELKEQHARSESALQTRGGTAENATREARTSEALLQGEIRTLKEQNRALTAGANDAGTTVPAVVTPDVSRTKKEKQSE